MERAHLDELIELENRYWWHVAKRKIATDLLRKYVPSPARIVEGGIGAAGNLLNWKQCGYDVSGLDIMDDSVTHAKSIGINEIYKHDLQQPWPCGSWRTYVQAHQEFLCKEITTPTPTASPDNIN